MTMASIFVEDDRTSLITSEDFFISLMQTLAGIPVGIPHSASQYNLGYNRHRAPLNNIR
jgi:hypothetical protein